MPSGATHDQITLTCLPVVGGITLLTSHSASITLSLTGSFLFGGMMFGPDLDIYSVQFKRWGVLRWIWYPYQKSLQHRSWLSHGPLIGTVLRLLYLGGWVVLLGIVISGTLFVAAGSSDFTDGGMIKIWRQILSVVQSFAFRYDWEIIAALVGLELGAMSHTLSDGLGSVLKKWFKRKPRRSRLRP